MSYGDFVATLALLTDIGILWILIKEFNYDKIQYEKDEYRRRARKKPRHEFERLTTGEMQ